MATQFPPRGPGAELRGRGSETGVLDRLVDGVRAGESRALVLVGDPGVGKSALLDYVAGHAAGCRVERATGIQSEMELAFAALHQLCAPMLDHLNGLPVPQRDALRTAFGLNAGPAPDGFLVGLAVLSLLSEIAEERPLICLVDDEQWLDRASAQALSFVARRLQAESVGLVFAARRRGRDLGGLPYLLVEGLREADALALLDTVVTGPLDERVREQLVAETRGNPLALLELPRGLTPAELAGGFGLPGSAQVPGSIEESFRRRIDALPVPTQRLLLVVAADPTGDPVLVWRAARRLGIDSDAALPASEAGLVDFGTWIRFCHPLVRSVIYRSASAQERQDVHRALAEVTDSRTDPDRRAWHLAEATPAPDEDVAAELERSAGRAQARGGMAAAAAFLERAAMLTPGAPRRAHRLLAAARAKRDAGALDAALGLLVAVEAGPVDALGSAGIELLRGQIAMEQRRSSEGARLLLSAAKRLEPLDAVLARDTYLQAVAAAIWTDEMDSPGGLLEAAKAARTAPPGPEPERAGDVLLDAFSIRLTDGFTAAEPAFARALEMVLELSTTADPQAGRWLWYAGGAASLMVAQELWEDESWHALATRAVDVHRESGALVRLQFALVFLAMAHLLAGELDTAARLIEEDRLIAEVTGNPPVAYTAMTLAAWRGREGPAVDVIDATMREATARSQGRLVSLGGYARAVLYNGLGRHDLACDAAWRAFERDPLGYGPFIVPELAEAASRTGDLARARAALEWLSPRVRLRPTEWVLGIEARVRALLSEGEEADRLYRESIDRLGRTRIRAELARGHLLYGEWLRRQRRRADARHQLRTAHVLLEAMGARAFAERARRELLATGETARKRTLETTGELTAQELGIARLAREGLSNPQIGARLFISARTVQYHLSNVFAKLAISSRSQLDRALPAEPESAGRP
ncbi:MAG TPA: AAA family ATPase [Streptosporangiaceae bacterium]|nr:AAA family ATPase [Streptosporangiaceae bacterium]